MNLLSKLLSEAVKPKMTAVKFSKANESGLRAEFKVSKQELRQQAELADAQARHGARPAPSPKATKTKPKAKAKVESKAKPKAKVEPKKKKVTKSKRKT